MEFADHRQEVKANTMKSVAFDTKINGNRRTSTRSKGKHYEINSEISGIRYELKWKS